MILYSIIPADIVFSEAQEEVRPQIYEAEYLGQKIQVVQCASNEYKITRVFSTQPGVYLDPRFQPGTIVRDIKIK